MQGHDTSESRHETRHSLTSHYVKICTTLLHYSQPFPPDNIIDLEMRNVLKRCMRVGRAAWLLWKEIVLLFRACAPHDDDDDEEETLGEYDQSTKTAEEDRK